MSDPRPPGLCKNCREHQLHHDGDVGHVVWYCPHRKGGTLALRGADAWRVVQGIPPDAYRRIAAELERGVALLDLVATGEVSESAAQKTVMKWHLEHLEEMRRRAAGEESA